MAVLAGVAVVLLLVVAAFSGAAAAHTGDDGLHHHDGFMGTHGMDGWMVGGFGFLWLFLWTVVLIGVPLALGYLWLTRRDAAGGTDDAIDVLRRRYARGEIDEDEFESRRNKLRADRR